MATSGSTDSTNTRNEIISAALRKLGQLSEGETASSQQVADAAGDLERLVKAWQAFGLHLWKYEECALFLSDDESEYDLGPTGDRFVLKSELVKTTISADAALGAGSVTLTSTTGVAASDVIGIVQDDDTIHWTTINGALVGSVATLTAVTTVAATSGNAVYVYTSRAPRPLQITQGRTQIDSTSEIELTKRGREDYFRLSNKSATGVPVEFHYNPTLTNGKLYLWPIADKETYYLNLTAQMPIEDFDSADNNPDMPVEWHDALIWNLAKKQGPEYGVDLNTMALIREEARESLELAKGFDAEDSDIVFMPDFS